MNTKTMTFPRLMLHTPVSGDLNKMTAEDHSIRINENMVFVNDMPVEAYRTDNAVYWENGEEKGCIWLYFHGLSGHGFIEKNGIKKEASFQAEDAEYEFSYKNKQGKLITYKFFMGTRNNPKTGGYLLYGRLMLGNQVIIESFQCDNDGNIKEGQVDNGFFRSSFLPDKRCLHAELDLSSRWVLDEETVHDCLGEDFNLWSASFDFSLDYTKISGDLYEQKTTGSITGKGLKYRLDGRESNTAEFSMVKCALPDKNRFLELENAFACLGEGPKSLVELYTLPAPDMKEANTLATQTLHYLAIYYVADKEYDCHGTKIAWNNWFGMVKEKAKDRILDVDSRILNLVEGKSANKKVQDFLEKYAKATLSSSYSGSTDETLKKALSGAKDRLKGKYEYCSLPDLCSFYLEGDDKECLANDPGYSIAMEEINRYTYAKLTPGLSKYINDPTEKWGEKLYNQCIANLQQLRITALSGSTGSTEVSHKSMMLNILDTDVHEISDGTEGKKKVSMTYGAALYAQAFNMQLSDLANSLGVEFVAMGKEGFVEMMRKIYNIIWEELQKKTSDYFSDDVLKQFQELQKQYADIQQEEFVQSCIDMTLAGMELIGQGKTLAALIPKLSSLSKKPWAAYSATVCSIVFYAVSLASLSTVFLNWDKSTAAEKAEAILTCVQGVANIALSAVKIYDIRILTNPAATFDEKTNAALRLRFGGEDMGTIKGLAKVNNGAEDFNAVVDDMGKRYSSTVRDAQGERAQISKATKFFKIAEIAVRVFNILMMAFITVMASVEIAKEAREGGYTATVYLEIVSTALMAVSCVCEVIVLVGDLVGVTCSVIPVIGAVCAFVGIIFQIVASAIRKPINPLEEFIKDTLVPFLNGLTIPTKEWVEKHKSKNELLLQSAPGVA